MSHPSNDVSSDLQPGNGASTKSGSLSVIPPPPPPPKPGKTRRFVPRSPALQENAFSTIRNSNFLRVMTAMNAPESIPDRPESPRPFQPCHMFFYGTLMDTEVLQTILQLTELPVVRPAKQFRKLVAYETNAYTWCECDVQLDNGEVLRDCRVFCWAGDPESRELDEGTFDLERWRRYFKGSIVRR
ncbi:hypothetical protein BDV95DRAFT_631464 [Massariosphaeria phaeospora]|uniref:Gamma-glutamylcyclotransferase AIG2-like domain-containing protein n=1 Tax=Massariosphaeria phaeospora TaxID=100035 RepID=A0A7C8M910_9PLEO|nr:hypothetical protein BDV95DRAFT_631464 [Massariosphaeria phaeospora]